VNEALPRGSARIFNHVLAEPGGWRALLVAYPASGCWLGPTVGGMGDGERTGWFSDAKVDHGGWRALWSRGCQVGIIHQIHGFLMVGGGISYFMFAMFKGLGSRRWDWSSPALSMGSVMVVNTFGAGGVGEELQ